LALRLPLELEFAPFMAYNIESAVPFLIPCGNFVKVNIAWVSFESILVVSENEGFMGCGAEVSYCFKADEAIFIELLKPLAFFVCLVEGGCDIGKSCN
jgi:hypothetical protein